MHFRLSEISCGGGINKMVKKGEFTNRSVKQTYSRAPISWPWQKSILHIIIAYNRKSTYLKGTFLSYFILFAEKTSSFYQKPLVNSDLYFVRIVSLNQSVQRLPLMAICNSLKNPFGFKLTSNWFARIIYRADMLLHTQQAM